MPRTLDLSPVERSHASPCRLLNRFLKGVRIEAATREPAAELPVEPLGETGSSLTQNPNEIFDSHAPEHSECIGDKVLPREGVAEHQMSERAVANRDDRWCLVEFEKLDCVACAEGEQDQDVRDCLICVPRTFRSAE